MCLPDVYWYLGKKSDGDGTKSFIGWPRLLQVRMFKEYDILRRDKTGHKLNYLISYDDQKTRKCFFVIYIYRG